MLLTFLLLRGSTSDAYRSIWAWLPVGKSQRRGRRRACRATDVFRVECLEPRLYLSGTPAADVQTMIDNGAPSNRVDLVFLGDGYTQSQIDTVYPVHIETALQHFFDANEDPFPRYRNFFNVHRIDVISSQSGVDQPLEGISRDTALDGTYNFDGIDRLAYIDDSKANAYLAQLSFTADMRLVTFNATKYGGGGGTYAVYAGGNGSSAEIALHELGHSFAGLADQYFTAGTTYSGGEPSEPDVTKSPTGDKWSEWLGYDQPGIGVIGAYEGGRYDASGIYRPSLNSKMKELGQPFDAIGREAFIQRIYTLVRPVDDALSTASAVSETAMLWADVVDPNVILAEWYVDGNLIQGATSTELVPADFGITSGTHTVTLRAYDPTDWVRRGTDALQQEIEWTVSAGTVTPGIKFLQSGNHLDLTEDGAAATYQIALTAPPTQDVSISLTTNGQLGIDAATLQFTPENWNIPQTITVMALADDAVEGDQVGRIIHRISSGDSNYDQLPVPLQEVIVRDAEPTHENHAPQVSNQLANADSDWVNGTFVTTLAGYDVDVGQTLLWSILDGNEAGAFALDPTSGDIIVADSTLLNPETNPEFQLTVRLADNGTPSLSTIGVLTIHVVSGSSQPAVSLDLRSIEVAYPVRSSPILLSPLATFQTFGGNGDLTNAVLSVKFLGKHAGADRLGILSSGGSGGISLDGTAVRFGGSTIGSLFGKVKKGLQITFNENANAAAVQALVRHLTFRSNSKKPGSARTVTAQLSNFQGVDSDPGFVQVVPHS